MWVFTETGFVSAVKKDLDSSVVVVRSRDRQSLVQLAQSAKVDIGQSPDGDYPWRVYVQQVQFADWVSSAALEVNYENFKNHIKQTRGPRFADLLGEVWAVMLHAEEPDSRSDMNWVDPNPKEVE